MKIQKESVVERFYNISNILVYVVYMVLLLVVICGKKNYHTDEISTYILSNNTYTDSIAIDPEIGYKYTDPEEIWIKSMSVSRNQRFNYANVWKQQKNDVHPPMYYVLVHTICSFFPDKFSKWYSASINIFFAIFTLYIVRKITDFLNYNKITKLLVSGCFVVSPGILSAVSFFRMYIMAMFLATLITYIFMLLAQTHNRYYYFAIFGISVVGALTHYYFIIFLFAICLVYGIYLIIAKRYKETAFFVATMVVAGISSLLLFPAMIDHSIGGGYRGNETLVCLKETNLYLIWRRISWSFDIINTQLFGGILIVFLLLAVVLIVRERNNIGIEWVLLTVPSVIYFILISKMIPMVTDRYFHHIYALVMIFVVGMVCSSIQSLVKSKYAVIILIILFTISSFKEYKNNWNYLYRHSQQLIDFAQNHNNLDCIYIFDENYEINPSFMEVREYKSVTFIKDFDEDILQKVDCNVNEGLVVCANKDFEADKVIEYINSKWPTLTQCNIIDTYSFASTYYFTSD